MALANLGTAYPYHLVHLARGDDDARAPRHLHAVFHGAYDWHSSVHMHWTLARCLRRFPSLPLADAIANHFDTRLTAPAVAGEVAYCSVRPTFERPYGWGWLLMLQSELAALANAHPAASHWRDALAPLAGLLAQRFVDVLPRLDYPVRAGAHTNSAFALVLAWDYAQAQQHRALAAAIAARAPAWFAADRRYPAEYEPSGDDFLSGGLTEALLMLRVSNGCDFADWWEAFAPAPAALARWLAPARVSDATDAKIVHLHGLNLSRTWCWRQLLPHLPPDLQPAVERAITAHIAASLPAATSGDYVGTHWLASFALLALEPAG